MLMGLHGDAPGEAAELPKGCWGRRPARAPHRGECPNPPLVGCGCGQATAKVSLIGEMPPPSPTVTRRSPRGGCVILARCSFFRRNTLTVPSSVRHKVQASLRNKTNEHPTLVRGIFKALSC